MCVITLACDSNYVVLCTFQWSNNESAHTFSLLRTMNQLKLTVTVRQLFYTDTSVRLTSLTQLVKRIMLSSEIIISVVVKGFSVCSR